MSNPAENGKARAVWFGIVDVMILLILAGLICSMFLIDGDTDAGHEASGECLVFSVAVQMPYDKALFLQEGNGDAVSLSIRGNEDPFGNLILGDDGVFYVECDLVAVDASQDREGLWMLGDTVLMSGALLQVESELADFTVTVLSVPVRATEGSAGTTEVPTETTDGPETETPAPENGSDSPAQTVETDALSVDSASDMGSSTQGSNE